VLCIEPNPITGDLRLVNPQPEDTGACAYVIASGAELGNLPWNLTVEQALEIGLYIWVAFAVAFGFRKIAEFLWRDREEPES